jgi:hypothetical protein
MYVDDFNILSRVYQVRIQDEPGFRGQVEEIQRLYVRGGNGKLVPLRSIVTPSTSFGPNTISPLQSLFGSICDRLGGVGDEHWPSTRNDGSDGARNPS